MQETWIVYSELLGFRILPNVGYSKHRKTQRLENWISFRLQVREETPTVLGALERANFKSLDNPRQNYFTTGGLPPISSS
jgi:hypothetical protein